MNHEGFENSKVKSFNQEIMEGDSSDSRDSSSRVYRSEGVSLGMEESSAGFCGAWMRVIGGLLFAMFLAGPLSASGDSVVVINEIHYHPENPLLEYVELHNELSVNVDLSGWRFDGGITFGFPEGTVIPARGFLVVAKDPLALAAATGATGVLGPFVGNLANEGETLRLWNNNGALRTMAAPPASPDAGELWSVDLQGDGVGGVFGQVAPTTMVGVEPASGFGNVWNALTLASHPATSVNPGIGAMVDSSGSATGLSFGINGTVSGFTYGGSGGTTVLFNDYLFLNAGNSASSITWQIGGADPGETHSMWFYGSSVRSVRIKVDVNGNGSLADDAAVTAPAGGGVLVGGILPQASGLIIGNADAPGGETNWSGFQLFVPASGGNTGYDPGSHDTGLERRRLMDEVAYGDRGDWPTGPDGSGYTLAKIEPRGGNGFANWTTSRQVNGTPGVSNFSSSGEAVGPTVGFHEISGAADLKFRLELHHYGTVPVDLSGWQILGGAMTYLIPGGMLAPGGFVVIDDTELGFRPAVGTPLFLVSPDRFADAVSVDTVARGRQEPGRGKWLVPSEPTFGAVNVFMIEQDVVINEVLHTDFDDGGEEWLELKNKGGETIDLGGWRLSGGIAYDFAPGTMISGGGFLVVAKDAAVLSAKYPGRPVIGNYTGRLGGSDRIVLEDGNGNPADEVVYFDHAPWPVNADGGGSSMELRDAASDNSVPAAWGGSEAGQLGGWQEIVYQGVATDDGIGFDVFRDFMLGMLDAGEILIDDLSVRENPSGANVEFLEHRDFESDTIGQPPVGWRCLGNHGQGRTQVVADPDDASNQCLKVVATGNTEDKHNRIETTFLNGRSVVVGRTYRVSFRARWLSGSNQVNTRLYFNFLQRTTLLGVGEQWGTPGVENSIATGQSGPSVRGLTHHPAVPGAGVAVTVSAEISDPQGLSVPQVRYRVGTGAWQGVAMSLNGEGRYQAILPGRPAGSLVAFHVRAGDVSGAVSDYPTGGENGGAFYRVASGDADTSGIRGNLRVLISPENEGLLFSSTNRMSNDAFPATVIEDERVIYYGCGLRLKGSAFGRYAGTEFGYNIGFPAGNAFRGVHDSVSIERSGNMKEIVAKHLLNRAGGGYWSQYDDVAKVNGPGVSGIALIAASRTTDVFLQSLHPEFPTGTVFNHELLYQPNGTVDGNERSLKLNNPYNHNRGTYDLADRGDDKEAYRWGWQIRSKRGGDDYSSIVRLNRAFALSGAAFADEMSETIDVDQWMRTWAIMGLYGNDDQFGRLYAHNWRVYQRPTDGRLIALPWDLDRAFNLGTNSPMLPTSHAITGLFAVPSFKRAFDHHLLDLVRTTFNADYMTSWIGHLGLVTGESGEFAGLAGYVSGRSGFAMTTLPAQVPFAITTHGGAGFSTGGDSVVLEGTGWSDVAMIARDGIAVPLAVDWSGPTSWSTTVSLQLGVNVISLIARNSQGVVVGSDQITITSTAPTLAATAENLVISELHYNPAGATTAEIAAGFSTGDFEFIELMNISSTHAVSLANVRFDQGIAHEFAEGAVIPPGGRVVLARRASAFSLRHPGVAVVGEFYDLVNPSGNQFSNGGEAVTLRGVGGEVIQSFVYDDAEPWPLEADGAGASLVLIAPWLNPDANDPLNWRASTTVSGNPGASDSLPAFAGDPGADSDGNGHADLVDYVLGGGAEPVAVPSGGGMIFSFERDRLAQAVVEVERSVDLSSWETVVDGVVLSRVATGASTERVGIAVTQPPGTEGRLFLRMRVKAE